MSSKQILPSFLALAIAMGSAFAQAVSSNIIGTVTDPGDASIPGVVVQLKDQGTGMTRTSTTGSEGIFRFTNLPPAIYTVTLKAEGFKTHTEQDINLASSETRDLGKIKLTLGSLTEQVTVTAAVTPIQTASSERSALVDRTQINRVALKGRNMMAFLNLVPGVVSTRQAETTAQDSLGGVSINGAGGNRVNFTVDGIVDMDSGSNGHTHYEPNLDAIAEIRILTTNFQAEYGRMSSGQINVVTKSGAQDFHGTAFSTKRHEMFNARSFFENFEGRPKSVYRYLVSGFSVGGPAYIPRIFNTRKQKLFFFVSQEYTKQKPSTQTGYYNMPTELERRGDFSQSFDQNGRLIPIFDPTTRAPYPGNRIPTPPDPAGMAILNFFPLPNRCGASGAASDCWQEIDQTQFYRRNYRYRFNNVHPRRNDVIRFDGNLTSKLTAWGRYINDYDLEQTSGNMALLNSKNQWTPYSEYHPNPGHGWGFGFTYTITPKIVNEFSYGKSFNAWDWYAYDPSQLDRARMGNPPHWFDENDPTFKKDGKRPGLPPGSQNYALYVPQVSFGGGATVGQASFTQSRPYTNWNDMYLVSDNFSVVTGPHSLKAGFFYERTGKVQQGGQGAYLGSYNFGSTSANPRDTGNGYANAYVGNFQTYSEGKRVIGDFWYTGMEFFLQDNWRVNRRLTLDGGIRLYRLMPQENLNGLSAAFIESTYDPKLAPRLYYPGYDAKGNQVAKDLATGHTTYPALVGTFVPYSVGGYAVPPSYSNGMVVADAKNPLLPLSIFTVPALVPAFRIGLAWDVFGNGKTALRTGFGQFFNRGDGNQIMGMNGNPPVTQSRTLYYAPISSVVTSGASGAATPISPGQVVGSQKLEGLMNGSFGIQQNLGFGTVLDVSYVGSFRRHVLQSRQFNAIPMFARYDPQNQDPWKARLPAHANRSLGDNFIRPIAGLGGLTRSAFSGSSNYHSLQVAVRRAISQGLSYGLAYTWSKTMSSSPSPYWPDKFRNYGPSGIPHILVFNYIYELPNLGKRWGNRLLGVVTDRWTISGLTSIQVGNRVSVGCCSWTGTNTLNPGPDMTGSAEGARINVLGNPALPKDQVTFSRTFDTSVFAPPTPCSWINRNMGCFGNAGVGGFYAPIGMNNWDMNFAKSFPLKGEGRVLIFRAEMYNIPNHTQFSGVNTSATFDWPQFQAGRIVQTNPQFGRYSSARAPRQMAMTLRFEF